MVVVVSGRGDPAWGQSQSAEVRERCDHATVMVLTKYSKSSEGDTLFGTGSGYFINRTGLCISNNHVVDPGHHKSQQEKFELKGSLNRLVWNVVVDGGTDDEKVYRADVLYQNERADQALLQVYGEDGDFLEWEHYLGFFPGRRLRIGQKAWCYGFPGGNSRKGDKGEHSRVAVTDGHVVDLPRRPDGDVKMIETDVLANPGNSGGPFVDIDGNLLGTLTLGAQTEGRTNTTELVPADLTKEFITTAFQRGKVPSGIDLEPFYTHLVGEDGYVAVPGYPRLDRSDCLVLESKDRMCGAPVGESITLPTPLGKLRLPCAQMAYLLKQDREFGVILMDGGERLPFLRTDPEAVIEFRPTVGKAFTQALGNVEAVAFRKGNDLGDPPSGRNVLIGGTGYHVLVSSPEGEARFRTKLGVELPLPIESISHVSTDRTTGDRIIVITDGSEVTGEFLPHEIRATLSINGAPLKLSLAGVEYATIEVLKGKARRTRGHSLMDLFGDAASDMQGMAQALDNGEVEKVESQLARRYGTAVFKRQAPLKKNQIRLLRGVCHWHSGRYAQANREFRKLKRCEEEGIRWYAHAVAAVYERFPGGEYGERPLSDPAVFKQAGAVIAEEALGNALDLLSEVDAPPPGNRGMFMRMRKRLQNQSDDLMVASRLGNRAADDAVVRIWNFEARLCEGEIRRLEEEIEKKGEELSGLDSNARQWRGRRIERDVDSLVQARDATVEWFGEVQERLAEVGFIIDDPDRDID
ncbi:MAG: serine protease [bacterium]|nr:serine protease [bacterium]